MVFKRLLGSLGVGGPTVDTILDAGAALPGGSLTGRVRLTGGKTDAAIEQITLELVARVEAEHDDGESEGTVTFERLVIGGGFRLTAGERHEVPFDVTLPWETPFTELYGQPLGVVLGVRTELAVAGAKDKGDLDPLAVRPLPAQEAVLEALGQIGCVFTSADLEYGRIHGTGQRLPFHQEIELVPPSRYARPVREIEVTFLAGADGMEVVLEADKRGGFMSDGHDVIARFAVRYDPPHPDWTTEVDGWLRQLLSDHSTPHSAAHSAPHAHAHHATPGVGTAVAAGAVGLAVGVAAGMVAAEVIDEVGDSFEDDEEG
ncbi:sporulation protein [Streptomyces sp. NPDC020965]|uniref:sporulation protein n=1 Tax=Streptomyces sp. NPDC020965 TaxID=3365105 RepID=UPI0037B6A06A